MTVVYAKESYDDIIEDIKPLLHRHWQELAAFPDIALEPDYEFYRRADSLGVIRIYSARRDGRLVGYAIYTIVRRHPHYLQQSFACSDIVWVAPEYRRSGVGFGLYDFIEADLPGFVISTDDKIDHPELGALMKARGYYPQTTRWVKRL